MQKFRDKIDTIFLKALNGERLSRNEGLKLFNQADLFELGLIANSLNLKKHPEDSPITFVIDRNINYTNVCSNECKFCAFYKSKDDSEAYVLDYSEIKKKVEELISIGGTQLLLQGGLNSEIALSYYVDMLSNLRDDFPELSIHAFSPPEIAFIAEQNNLNIRDILVKFKDAGLSSIPGGGAEILVDNVRSQISPNKLKSGRWLEVMEVAHELSMPTSATMMAGSVETKEDIIDHLIKLRDLQDKTKGFIAFIPWTFQSNNTKILPEYLYTGIDYLKLVSIARIMLDNFDNIQVSWPTQGFKIAQIALTFGANDFGGVMMEENVLASTGLRIDPSVDKVIQSIKAINRLPAQRDTRYNFLKTFY